MSREVEEEEEKRRLHRKLEEALEAKSLRRIISAYLNYPEASEEDVKRWERSFRKLPPAHKALLSHYPIKFQNLRRCISMNSYFIFNMLQAFEAPLDLSQDLDICEDSNPDSAPNDNHILDERHDSTCQPASTNNCEYQENPEGSKDVYKSETGVPSNEELQRDNPHDRPPMDRSGDTRMNKETCNRDGHPISYDDCNVSSPSRDWLDPSLQIHVPLVDVDKVRCIIRNIVRDWAVEGQKERDQCYKPILEELDSLFPNRRKQSPPPACLVPGAGLGRLALEISCLGFISQGNEFSYYMMICSSFILNHAGITDGFSMCGGEFVEVYKDPSQEGMWDAVVTCFFIDTAHNVIEYIEIISKVLKDGGVWINLGPLLYHFADTYGHEDEMSIELSLEDVKRVAFHFGFEIEKERTIKTTYTTNHRSMMQNRYYAAFWTMRKKPSPAT
ncbi:PREDICTED: carnosine N-methyltransferase-like isoform X2 [Tarenaya hassleriana]|uniref:carnosine N-methyltransferase-like isoform X2 n=1 Tax=Tarenaya hassleriana TaxID=28532 RepID=UPI00053C8B70|nr:PREDICTED: carnosine N-methyltransferase-like isoform X2 [Tarenaya hassleriana]